MSLATGTRIGPYEILGPIGAGGMGEVYRARDSKLQRDVAIKILPAAFATDPDRLARLEREAQVLASLNHPNIAAIYGFEERALVLELVDGPTLADRIAQGPIPIDEALPIARQIAEALEAAHEHGVIHRDLKPANIKLRADGTVKVLDFGLAKLHDPNVSHGSNDPNALSLSPTIMSPAHTQLGVILGTAAYMSPEQARGKAVDRRADIWGFGCVLYEMLTGMAPFAGEDVSLTLSKILQRDPDWSALPADTPDAMVPLLRRCLEKDPKRRLRDIGEARVVLEGSPAQPASRPRRSITLTVAVPVLVAAVILTGLAVWALKPAATGGGAAAPVVRLSVTMPEGERIAGAGGFGANGWHPLAVSPDGTQLAYVSGGRLYLRAMNSLGVRPTQGTDGAASPFFSPDSQWVGFFAQGQLRKVSVAGGVATPLTDAPVAAGGSWSEDGWVYFAPTNTAGLLRVRADGGAAEPVTTLDRSKGEVSHRWPHVLPGGNAILFTVWRGPGFDEMDIQLHRVADATRSVVIQGGTTGRYMPSGHLVYARAGEMTAVRFDLTRMAAVGSPVSLGIRVREVEGAHYTVSDGGVLAYVPGYAQFERRLIRVSPDGRVEDLEAPLRAYEDVHLSPDGSRAALTVQGATWGIWVFDLERKTDTLLTRATGTSQWPVWTADGRRLVYRGTRAGFRNLYWRNADGTGTEERLTTSERMQTPSSVSSDGQWVAFDEVDPKTGNDVGLLSLAGNRSTKPFLNTPAAEGSLRFSPDDRWVTYTADDSGLDQVYVQPFPGGERVPVSTRGGTLPRWSADGRRLFYREGDAMMTVEISTTPTLRVGTPQRMFTAPDRLGEYDVTADGGFLGIQRTDPIEASTQIHVVVNWFEELRRMLPVN